MTKEEFDKDMKEYKEFLISEGYDEEDREPLMEIRMYDNLILLERGE